MYTAKIHSKSYECVIIQVKKVRWLLSENAQKVFGGRATPRPAGGAYSAPPDP